MTAYYNEHDPFAAAWLRELIRHGHIADGVVDEQDIQDVEARDLEGFIQCHFFAGIGGWSYALRLAGWPDDRPVWTGSCPCQPFSAAGRGRGTDDPRHLWPVWARLIQECRPAIIFGEQVASPAGLGWFDAVHTDLEGAGYAVGAADLCAAGVGAPHIRQRLWFVADAGYRIGGCSNAGTGGPPYTHGQENHQASEHDRQLDRLADAQREQRARCRDAGRGREESSDSGDAGELANPSSERRQGLNPLLRERGPHQAGAEAAGGGEADRTVGHPNYPRSQGRGLLGPTACGNGGREQPTGPSGPDGPTGFWSACIWLPCLDGKYRPVESGIFPLAAGVPHRVGLLRGAGNSIVPQVAATFILAYLDTQVEILSP